MAFPSQVFYINLDRRPEMKEAFETEWSPFLETRRISGVTTEQTGWLGCTHAHVKALNAAMKEGEGEYLLIMEDDAMMVDGFERLKSGFVQALERGFDVLMYNVVYEEFKDEKTSSEDHNLQVVRDLLFANSMACYIVRRGYLPRILETLKTALIQGRRTLDRVEYGNDMYMNTMVARDRWATVTPNPVHQRDSYSDLDERFEVKKQTL